MSKIAIVTGGSKGIGFSTAQAFAASGYKIIICSRNQLEIEAAANQIKEQYNADITGISCDVSDKEQIDLLFSKCKNMYGTPDILVNSAAIIKEHKFIDTDISDFSEVMMVNFFGTMLACQKAFKYMEKPGGTIINISSLAGIANFQKFPGYSSYVASKFAVTGLTEALAEEGKEYNIRVNAIAPGAVDTDMLHSINMKSSTKAEDIAKTIYYLANSDQSGHITGSTLIINCNE